MATSRLARLAFMGAVPAASALGAPSASASLPLFLPATTNKFSTSGGSAKLAAGGDSVTCSSASSTGEINGAMEVGDLVLSYSGCTSTGGSKAGCSAHSKNASSEGVIITNTLHALLGLILKSAGVPEKPLDVGLLLLPHAGPTLTEVVGSSCTPTTKIIGSVAGLLTPIGVSTTRAYLNFGLSGAGNEEIKELDVLGRTVEPELEAFGNVATYVGCNAVAWESHAEEIT